MLGVLLELASVEGKRWKQDWPEGELSCDAMRASLDLGESCEGEMILDRHPRRSEEVGLHTHMSVSRWMPLFQKGCDDEVAFLSQGNPQRG